MGLSCSQIQLLALTKRKSMIEYNQSMIAMKKMALSKEMSQLSSEYYSALHSKNIAYYDNGSYHKINYNYLMGYGQNWSAITSGEYPLKNDNSMILTDSRGQVVLSYSYANAITSVLGSSVVDNFGRGNTFSTDYIPQILSRLLPGISEEQIINGISQREYNAHDVNSITGEATGGTSVIDNTDAVQSMLDQVLDVYYPIFKAAAANGWTTEYNQFISENDDYISDAINSGTLVLTQVGDDGMYKADASLTYFLTSGDIQSVTDQDEREEITAKYNSQKEEINQKETLLDLQQQDLTTEIQAIEQEITTMKSFIQNAIQSVFNWGTNA